MNSQLKPKLPIRSKRFGIGKEIGGAVYIHRKYAANIFGDDYIRAVKLVPKNHDFTIVKLIIKSGVFSFIECVDFDLVDEPIVGASFIVYPNKITRCIKAPTDPWIYHHKWLMVDSNYSGFSISESINRSQQWISLSNVDYSRIGKKSFWIKHVTARLKTL